MQLSPEEAVSVVKAAYVLHNFVRERDKYNLEESMELNLQKTQISGCISHASNHTLNMRDEMRDEMDNYFVSETGAVD